MGKNWIKWNHKIMHPMCRTKFEISIANPFDDFYKTAYWIKNFISAWNLFKWDFSFSSFFSPLLKRFSLKRWKINSNNKRIKRMRGKNYKELLLEMNWSHISDSSTISSHFSFVFFLFHSILSSQSEKLPFGCYRNEISRWKYKRHFGCDKQTFSI